MIWHILDIFFVVFHTSIIIFSLTGWLWKKTRKWNLILLALIGCSWLFLGLIVGVLGYCPLTGWHFDVLEKLGRTDLPYSYVKYLADRLTGLHFDAKLVDNATLYSFLAAFVISIVFNIRDVVRRRRQSQEKERERG
ncbi:MAG: DUF2784 family protein [Bacteroidia bacterium]|nr:DUF2784 family protein [Bacteroidia bacterium]